MLDTLLGMLIADRLVQFRNALSPMVVTLLPRVAVDNLAQL